MNKCNSSAFSKIHCNQSWQMYAGFPCTCTEYSGSGTETVRSYTNKG